MGDRTLKFLYYLAWVVGAIATVLLIYGIMNALINLK